MSNRNKSPKDLAFEKERAKFRNEIRQLEYEVSNKNKEIYLLKERIRDLESEIASKDDWIRRLLEYTEMSEEDMKKVISRDKTMSEVSGSMAGLLDVLLNHMI